VLHASVDRQRVGKGADTLGSARSPQWLGGKQGMYSHLRAGLYAMLLVGVAIREGIFGVVVDCYVQIVKLQA